MGEKETELNTKKNQGFGLVFAALSGIFAAERMALAQHGRRWRTGKFVVYRNERIHGKTFHPNSA